MKSSKRDWLIPAGLILLSLVPAVAGSARLVQVGGGEVTPETVRFLDQPLPLLIHIPTAIVYSLLGALQFSPAFRRSNRPWHRAAGKLLLVCGSAVALTGLWMAHFYAWPVWDGYAVYVERIIVGWAMLVCIGLGINAIRLRDFKVHGEWMIRAYAIALGAGTQVLTHIPWFILVGEPMLEFPRAVMMGGAWALNILVAEWIIRRGRNAVAMRTPHLVAA
jgi:hypothetical protein